jgi:hypothetical protein
VPLTDAVGEPVRDVVTVPDMLPEMVFVTQPDAD